MKPDPQAPKRKSSRGLFLMCAGVMAVLLSESPLFLVLGAALEIGGLLLFIGGMWQQKKQRDAELLAPQNEAAQDDASGQDDASDTPAAPVSDAHGEVPAPESPAPQENKPGWEYDS